MLDDNEALVFVVQTNVPDMPSCVSKHAVS